MNKRDFEIYKKGYDAALKLLIDKISDKELVQLYIKLHKNKLEFCKYAKSDVE